MKKSVFMSALVASSLAFSGVHAIGPDPQEEKQGCWAGCKSCFKKTRKHVEEAAEVLTDGARSVAAIAQWGAEFAKIIGLDGQVVDRLQDVGKWSDISSRGLTLVQRFADQNNVDLTDELYAGLRTFEKMRNNGDDNPEEQALAGLEAFETMLAKVDKKQDPEAAEFMADLKAYKEKTKAAVAKVNDASDLRTAITEISIASAALVGSQNGLLSNVFGFNEEWQRTLSTGASIVQRLKIRSTPELMQSLVALKQSIEAAKAADVENPHQQVLEAMHMFDVLLAKANTNGNKEVGQFVLQLAELRRRIQADMVKKAKEGVTDVADVTVALQQQLSAVPVVPQFVDVPMLQSGAGVQPVVTGSIVPVPAVGANGGTTQV